MINVAPLVDPVLVAQFLTKDLALKKENFVNNSIAPAAPSALHEFESLKLVTLVMVAAVVAMVQLSFPLVLTSAWGNFLLSVLILALMLIPGYLSLVGVETFVVPSFPDIPLSLVLS